jgi:hypothetical protein
MITWIITHLLVFLCGLDSNSFDDGEHIFLEAYIRYIYLSLIVLLTKGEPKWLCLKIIKTLACYFFFLRIQ